MFKWLMGKWHARQRAIDLQILWPVCCDLAISIDHAKAAFATHAFADPAWLCLGHDAIVVCIDALAPVNRCPHWQKWDDCPVCCH
jgi:hypothetical protein